METKKDIYHFVFNKIELQKADSLISFININRLEITTNYSRKDTEKVYNYLVEHANHKNHAYYNLKDALSSGIGILEKCILEGNFEYAIKFIGLEMTAFVNDYKNIINAGYMTKQDFNSIKEYYDILLAYSTYNKYQDSEQLKKPITVLDKSKNPLIMVLMEKYHKIQQGFLKP